MVLLLMMFWGKSKPENVGNLFIYEQRWETSLAEYLWIASLPGAIALMFWRVKRVTEREAEKASDKVDQFKSQNQHKRGH